MCSHIDFLMLSKFTQLQSTEFSDVQHFIQTNPIVNKTNSRKMKQILEEPLIKQHSCKMRRDLYLARERDGTLGGKYRIVEQISRKHFAYKCFQTLSVFTATPEYRK